MPPSYNLDKIKFATDEPTFERAVGLYENKKVTQFEVNGLHGYSAVVLGTKPYQVTVSARRYDEGHCECYLGQKDVLCKHMVAVAIYSLKNGEKLSDKEKAIASEPTCSGDLGELSPERLSETKKIITLALRYIKPYSGPSRTWFPYQNSLDEGCARLTTIVNDLPVSEQTSKLLVDLLLRTERKLMNGVDDSNGTVGDFMTGTVVVLEDFAKIDSACTKPFTLLKNRETSFGWEEPLLELLDK